MISTIIFTVIAFFLLELFADKSCCAGVKIDTKKTIALTILLSILFYTINKIL
jgi:hypothetical protein